MFDNSSSKLLVLSYYKVIEYPQADFTEKVQLFEVAGKNKNKVIKIK